MDSLRGEWRSAMRRTPRALIHRAPGEQDHCPACGGSRLYELDLRPLRRPVVGCRTGVEPLRSPAAAARDAVRKYHASVEGRPLLERLGLFRLAGRAAEGRRRRAVSDRKSKKHIRGHLVT